MATLYQPITISNGLAIQILGSGFAIAGVIGLYCGVETYGTQVVGKHGHLHTAGFEVIILPLFFLAIGIGMAGVRQRKVIDVGNRLILTTTGWAFSTTTRSEGPFTDVCIGPKVHRKVGRTKNGQDIYADVIPVCVAIGDSAIELDAPKDAHAAYDLAIRVALGTGLPLKNFLEAHDRPRPTDSLDPPKSIIVQETPRGSVLTLPWERGSILLVGTWIAVPEVIVALLYYAELLAPTTLPLAIVAATVPSIFAVFGMRLLSGRLGAALTVTNAGLQYGRWTISADDIRVCTHIGKAGILILTDRDDLVIAADQNDEIQHWLVGFIRRQLGLAPATDPLASVPASTTPHPAHSTAPAQVHAPTGIPPTREPHHDPRRH